MSVDVLWRGGRYKAKAYFRAKAYFLVLVLAYLLWGKLAKTPHDRNLKLPTKRRFVRVAKPFDHSLGSSDR